MSSADNKQREWKPASINVYAGEGRDPLEIMPLLKDPGDELEKYKAGLIVDKVHNVKCLAEPKRWCVLPETETVTVEVPLTYHDWQYEKEVVQELGHVA